MTDHPLLDIQHLDTLAEQLRHRRATLPSRAERDGAVAQQAGIETEITTIGVARLEVASRQRRFEDEAQIFAAKAEEDDRRLYSGEVGVKDLQALQNEIAGLRSRQGALEDEALEAMEEAEALTGQLADAEQRLAAVAETITVLEAEIAVAEDEIVAELADVEDRRAHAAQEVSAEHLAQYERLRPGLGSATVVGFDGRNCVGCPSTMPAMELDRMKHAAPGSVLDCDECGRIVVT